MATLKQVKERIKDTEGAMPEEAPDQSELEIKGPGVERVKIAAVETAARRYTNLRDERMERLQEEIKAKARLLEVMHENEGQIPKDKDGSMIYRFKDQVIILRPGKEDVKVKTVSVGPQDSENASSNGSE